MRLHPCGVTSLLHGDVQYSPFILYRRRILFNSYFFAIMHTHIHTIENTRIFLWHRWKIYGHIYYRFNNHLTHISIVREIFPPFSVFTLSYASYYIEIRDLTLYNPGFQIAVKHILYFQLNFNLVYTIIID